MKMEFDGKILGILKMKLEFDGKILVRYSKNKMKVDCGIREIHLV